MNKRIPNNEDAQRVNFREVQVGSITPGTLYRSSHPILSDSDGQHLRQSKTIAMLAGYARIGCIINLCDTMEELHARAVVAPWYHRLIEQDCVVALNMNFDTTSFTAAQKLARGFRFIIAHPGPYLVHCYAGFDRTGFFIMVLAAFMGGKIEDIARDYLRSLDSDFTSAKDNPGDISVVRSILQVMSRDTPLTNDNLQSITEMWLRETAGLETAELTALKMRLGGTTR